MSPEMLPFAYGVNEFTTMPWTFEEDVENYARLGVEALELCEVKLDEDKMDEQLAMVGEAGLSVPSVEPAVRAMIPSAGQPAEIAPAFVLLASQESSNVNAEVLGATGGTPLP